jgi:hypothetical protein
MPSTPSPGRPQHPWVLARAFAHLGPGSRIALLCGAVAAVAMPLALGPVLELRALPAPVRLPWWLVALITVAVELLVVRAQFRRDSVDFTFGEVALVVLLDFATPVQLLAGLVAGRTVGRLLYDAIRNRQASAPSRLSFEAATTLLEGCIALLVVHAIVDGEPLASPKGWLAAFAATIGVDLLRGVLIELAMLSVGAPLPRGAGRPTTASAWSSPSPRPAWP